MVQARAAAFDGMAEGYDAEFTATALGRELRARVWDQLATAFASRQRILELGCGTGEDAVWLACAGHRVVALDASADMIRVARRKAISAGCGDRIEFHCLPMEDCHELAHGAPFDGVFSNFGAVNCVADLAALSRTLANMLRPGAPLLFVAMGRYVPWEWAWYLARGDASRAFRRLRKQGAEWRSHTIQYPTPRELSRALGPGFTVRRRASLGLALPPTYAGGWLDSFPRAFSLLTTLDRATSRVTSTFGDHYILEAVRA